MRHKRGKKKPPPPPKPPREPVELGKWYRTATCKACHKDFPFMRDDSEGKIKFVGPGILAIKCAFCQHEGTYRTDEIVSQQLLGIVQDDLGST